MIKKIIRYADKKIEFKRFIKFGITGFINTGVDWLAFTILCEIFNMRPRHAQIIAHALAIINSYIINKNWTFKNNKTRGLNYNYIELIKFLIIQGTSLIIGYAGMYILHDNIGLNEYLCKALISCVTLVINYFGNKLFVFK